MKMDQVIIKSNNNTEIFLAEDTNGWQERLREINKAQGDCELSLRAHTGNHTCTISRVNGQEKIELSENFPQVKELPYTLNQYKNTGFLNHLLLTLAYFRRGILILPREGQADIIFWTGGNDLDVATS